MVGMAAFNASLSLLLSIGVDRIWERVRRLTEEAIGTALRAGYDVLSPQHPEERSGIVTFRVPGGDPQELWKALLARRAVCAARLGGLRISPHFYNTPEEITRFFELVGEEAERCRRGVQAGRQEKVRQDP